MSRSNAYVAQLHYLLHAEIGRLREALGVTARLKRMAPSLAIARKYRGLHTGWETARGTVRRASQCRVLAKR
jgi:hypothetical protein